VTDERWLEVERDILSATRHFAAAVRLSSDPALKHDDWDGYKTRMSRLHAMQAGHTSLETALLRVLDMRGEQRPTGDSWHLDLIRRVSAPATGRPAILTEATARAADQTRRFRHVAVRTYDQFEPDEATGAIRAADRLAASLTDEFIQFKQATEDSG
jgi:hypothetical protein